MVRDCNAVFSYYLGILAMYPCYEFSIKLNGHTTISGIFILYKNANTVNKSE